AILRHAAAGEALDVTALKAKLSDSNLPRLVDELTGKTLVWLNGFLRPDASPDEVKRGWEEAYSIHMLPILREELRAAEARVAADPSDLHLTQVKALAQALNEAEGRAAAHGSFGTGAPR